MRDSTTLTSDSSADSAFKDTIVDEYYSDITPQGVRDTHASLAENPYPGLRPFKTSESIVFFGREGISSEMITRLSKNRFLALLGASGTGKSSLVRAGLLPTLNILPGRHGNWKVVICRPGKNPFGNFAQAVSKAGIAPSYNLLDIWKITSGSSYGFEKLKKSIDDTEEYNTLIVIDQFEEIFRYRNDMGVAGKNDASLFVKMLIDISGNKSLNTYVIITMRSEYLGDCIQMPDLAEAINEGQYLVPRLKRQQLLDAIIDPTYFSGAELENEFAGRLIGEIGDNMDQLPVLQHALRRTYERAKKRTEDEKIKLGTGGQQETMEDKPLLVMYRDYIDVGRIQSALDEHANELYNSLTKKQQAYTIILFQSITDKASDGKGTRRPLSFATIIDICAEQKKVNAGDLNLRNDLKIAIDTFRQENVNFMMPPPHVPLTDELKIDISHESLMRIWGLLKIWIEKEATDAGLLKKLLDRDAKQYLKRGELSPYSEWLQRKNPGKSWAGLYRPADITDEVYVRKFSSGLGLINTSERKQKRRWVSVIGTVLSILFFIASFAIVYYFKNKELDSSKHELENKNRKLLDNKRMINQQNDALTAETNALTNKTTALNLTNKKLDSAKNKLDSAYHSLEEQNKLIEKKSVQLNENIADEKALVISLNRSRRQLEISNKDLSDKQDELEKAIDSATNLKNLALAIKYAEKSLGIPKFDSVSGNIKSQLAMLAFNSLQNSSETERNRFQPQIYAALYDAIKGKNGNDADKNLWNITSYKSRTDDHLAFASMIRQQDPATVYLTAENNFLYSVNALTGKLNNTVNLKKKLVGIKGSPAGRWSVLQTLDTIVYVMDNNINKQYMLHFPGVIRTAAFSPDEAMLYSFSNDSSIYTTNMDAIAAQNTTIQQIQWNKIDYKLEDMAVSKTFVYGLTNNGKVFRWDRTGKIEINITPKLNKSVRGTRIICSPDDGMVVWANENGQAFYLSAETNNKARYLTKFGGSISDIALSREGKFLAIASYDRTIRVYKLPELLAEVPLIITDNGGPVTAVFFTPENRLAAVTSPGIIKLYELDLQKLAASLQTDLKPLSDYEKNLYLGDWTTGQTLNIQK